MQISIDSNGILIRFQLILKELHLKILIDFKRNLEAALPNSLNKYAPLIINNF